MIKAVLFDLGGTLHTSSYTEERKVWFAKRLIDRLGDYGIVIDTDPTVFAEELAVNSEIYKQETQISLEEMPGDRIWSEYFLRGYGVSREQIAPYAEELSFIYDYERPRIMRRPHLKETIEALKAAGIRVGVISNIISLSVCPHFLWEYGILEDMDVVITSSETRVRKPSPEIFRVAEEKMGLKPEELAYVGDTKSRDVAGTRNAGWKLMIQIGNPGIAHRDAGLEGPAYDPDYAITDLAEIPGIIKQENEKEKEL